MLLAGLGTDFSGIIGVHVGRLVSARGVEVPEALLQEKGGEVRSGLGGEAPDEGPVLVHGLDLHLNVVLENLV